jgi:hypothetical protein
VVHQLEPGDGGLTDHSPREATGLLEAAGLDDPVEEQACLRFPGRREDLGRWTLLQDPATLEERHPVGDVAGKAHLVRRDDHGHAHPGEVPDDRQDLRDEHRVERRGDLVEQQDRRLHRQRADDGDPLLLSPGQPVGDGVALVEQAEPPAQLLRARLGVRPGQPEHLDGRKGDVPDHGHVREQVVGLEHDADAATHAVHVHAPRRDIRTLDEDAPGIDRLQQVDAAQQGALARPGRADEAYDLVVVDHQVDAVEDEVVPERLAQALDAQRRMARRPRVRPAGRDAHRAPARYRLRSRLMSQSTNRDRGTVSARNSSAETR